MNKLILHIVMTVTISLFGFGWLIDEFVYNSESVESEEDHPHQVILNGFVNHLGDASPDTLITRVKTLSEQFNANLVLERREDFAFEKDVFNELDTLGLQLVSEHGLYYLRPIPNHPEYLLKLTVARNTEGNRSLELILTLLLYFGVSVAVVLWMYPLIKRLKKLTRAANQFGKGNLSARVVPAKLSQINVLEESFNKMASQIEHLIEENRLLANSLSHDLRTPVACFRFALDACLDEPNVERKNEYLMRMEKDVENIEGMLKAFLDYASMERQGMQLVFRVTDMIDFLQSVVNDLQPIAKKKGVRLCLVTSEQEINSSFDNSWMYRVYLNLMTNAISYADRAVMVLLVKEKSNSKGQTNVVCYICDDGRGVAEHDMKKVFDAFVRLDSSRQRNGENFGLGLAIVKRVIDWHSFQVSFLPQEEHKTINSFLSQGDMQLNELGAVVRLTIPVLTRHI